MPKANTLSKLLMETQIKGDNVTAAENSQDGCRSLSSHQCQAPSTKVTENPQNSSLPSTWEVHHQPAPRRPGAGLRGLGGARSCSAPKGSWTVGQRHSTEPRCWNSQPFRWKDNASFSLALHSWLIPLLSPLPSMWLGTRRRWGPPHAWKDPPACETLVGPT